MRITGIVRSDSFDDMRRVRYQTTRCCLPPHGCRVHAAHRGARERHRHPPPQDDDRRRAGRRGHENQLFFFQPEDGIRDYKVTGVQTCALPIFLGGPMLAIATVGLAANLACAWLIREDAASSLNVRGAYLHVLGDALSSVGVMVAAFVMLLTDWTLADPLASAAIGLVIVPRTWALLRQAVNVLLEGTPPHLDLAEIEAAIQRVFGVRRVHDLHVWTLTSGREAMSAHVVVDDVGESDRLLRELHEVLHARFGIDHTTIQLETEPPAVLRIQGPSSV